MKTFWLWPTVGFVVAVLFAYLQSLRRAHKKKKIRLLLADFLDSWRPVDIIQLNLRSRGVRVSLPWLIGFLDDFIEEEKVIATREGGTLEYKWRYAWEHASGYVPTETAGEKALKCSGNVVFFCLITWSILFLVMKLFHVHGAAFLFSYALLLTIWGAAFSFCAFIESFAVPWLSQPSVWVHAVGAILTLQAGMEIFRSLMLT